VNDRNEVTRADREAAGTVATIDSRLTDPSLEATRSDVVRRALEFAAHGHGELPEAFMADARGVFVGVLRDSGRPHPPLPGTTGCGWHSPEPESESP